MLLTCNHLQSEVMGNCLDCLSPQPEVETPDPVSIFWSKFAVLSKIVIRELQ